MGGGFYRKKISQNQLLDDMVKVNQITTNELFQKKAGIVVSFRLHNESSFIKKLIASKIISVEIIRVSYNNLLKLLAKYAE